jgi:site-specific recombinase XerD
MRVAELQTRPSPRAPTQLRESLLQAGVDSTVIALWLGHADIRSTQPYIHADMTIKERALALTTPATVTPGRHAPTDDVLAYLDSLG